MPNFTNPRTSILQPKRHEGSALRSVRDSDAVARSWVKNTLQQKQNNSDGGAIGKLQMEVARLKRRIVGGGTSISQCYKIISESGDYVVAGTWDGTTLGDETPIAKDFLLQQSLTTRTIYGTVIDYTYAGTDPIIRTATPDSGSPVQEVISPAYAVGDLIYPEEVSYTGVVDGDGNPITLMDCKTSRVWATQP